MMFNTSVPAVDVVVVAFSVTVISMDMQYSNSIISTNSNKLSNKCIYF